MIDTLLKWIIWPFWRPYIVRERTKEIEGSKSYYSWYRIHFMHVGEERTKEFLSKWAAHEWAFEHLTWEGKLKEEKHEH